MQIMGPTQPGLPNPIAIPKNFHLIATDIKDCFFSIPLHPEDAPRYAFTVPSINHEGPDQRYHWKVLSQGRQTAQLYVRFL